MAIEFKENPYCKGNVQVIQEGQHIASIDRFAGTYNNINHASIDFDTHEKILTKMKELQGEMV